MAGFLNWVTGLFQQAQRCPLICSWSVERVKELEKQLKQVIENINNEHESSTKDKSYLENKCVEF